MLHKFVLVSLFFFVVSFFSHLIEAQAQTTSDPRALALAAQSIAALTGGTRIGDATMTASGSWLKGNSYETASATLTAKGTTESRVETRFGGGTRLDIRSGIAGAPQGKWSDANGSSNSYAVHNCWTDPVWFFPALTSLANFANPKYVFSYVGNETWNGLSTLHLRVHQQSQSFKEVSRLSTMDFYLDPSTHLPLGIGFDTHSDKDMSRDIASEILFADYRRIEGVYVPFHIQRLQSGAVLLDITLTSAMFNSGVPENIFSIE
jgi:hypothetical protein